MLIKFESNIKNGENTNKIEFTAAVELSVWNGFEVLEFEEPSIKEKNRIEISDAWVNIFAGKNTLNLSLNQKLKIEYLLDNQPVFFETHLHVVERNDKNYRIFYTLHNGDTVIGEYEIKITLIES